jgi:hypothetical protein
MSESEELEVSHRKRIADLAIELADFSAPAYLECSLTPIRIGDDIWYDLDSLGEDEKAEFSSALEYCELRGLLRRHSERPQLIQTLEP